MAVDDDKYRKHIPIKSWECARLACGKAGRWRPVLVLRAPQGPWPDVPVRALLGIVVCDDCKPKSGAQDFLSDAGWEMVMSGFDQTGHMRPERERTTLDWVLESVGS